MIKFFRSGILGAQTTEQYFITREVLIHLPVRDWVLDKPQIWVEIEAIGNKERALSLDLDITRRTFADRPLALIAGIKVLRTSLGSQRTLGAFKFSIVDDAFLVETLRQEYGVKIKRKSKWDDIRQAEEIQRR